MARRPFDPLDFVPSPEIVRQKLTETLTLAERLRILLELAERLRLPVTTADRLPTPATTEAKEGSRG
jgi:hypothetical protein